MAFDLYLETLYIVPKSKIFCVSLYRCRLLGNCFFVTMSDITMKCQLFLSASHNLLSSLLTN